jgi:hypothetical protein
MAPRRSSRWAAATARCIDALDTISTTVATAVRAVSSSTPSAGHTSLTERRVK